MSPRHPEISAADDLVQVRAKADAEFRDRLHELQNIIVHARKAMSEGRAACLAGLRADTPVIQYALEWADQVTQFIEMTAFLVAKNAVLTGRWPAEREAEAHALCADEDGLYDFLDAMEKVPIGFVDAPITVSATH